MQIDAFGTDTDQAPSPEISEVPDGSPSRLIDEGMMHYEASLAGLSERYSRGKTSHTIHVWWARRPHSAMRALVFSALCKGSSSVALKTLESLGTRPKPTKQAVDSAREILSSQYEPAPRVLDMFAGGGTIPLEACRLGAMTEACDVNELSTFIQRCLLEYSQDFKDGELPEAVQRSGNRVLQRVKEQSRPLYPLRDRGHFGYLWTYSMECPDCNYRFFLSKRRWLSKKKDKNLAFVFEDGESEQDVEIQDLGDRSGRLETAMGRSKATCPKCGSSHRDLSIQECRDELIGLVRLDEPTGKEFSLSTGNEFPSEKEISRLEEKILQSEDISLPDSELPEWSGIVNPALYGMETHCDLLNPRQRVLLLILIKNLISEYNYLVENENERKARCVIGLLSSLIDQVVDWNSRLSMWISQNEQVGRAFSGPGVAMLWDYAETDQLMDGPANLWSKLDRIVKGTEYIPKFEGKAGVRKVAAQNLPYEDNSFDAIVTDPPYYDNIYYSVLADFFYSWKKPVIDLVSPDARGGETTDFSDELVASAERSGSSEEAHEDYCEELSEALREAERVLQEDGVFSFIYSHNSLLGWDALVRAYRATDLRISSAQPLSIERRQRPRAMTSEAKNTCVAFVSRIYEGDRETVTLDDLISTLKEDYFRFAESLEDSGWSEADAALAAFSNSVGMLANASGVKGTPDTDVLRTLADLTEDRFPSFGISDRNSL